MTRGPGGLPTAAVALAVALPVVLAACARVADDELTVEEMCRHQVVPFLDVSAVTDDRGTGVRWTELTLLADLDKTYTVYRRAPGSGDPDASATDGPTPEWARVTEVVLPPDAPREVVPLDLPPGRWEVGVTFTDPDCGETPVCYAYVCVSVLLDARVDPTATA